MKALDNSKINTINNLLNLEGNKNKEEVLYKKTSRGFKRTYGIELQEAPVIFVKHNVIWKLIHIKYQSKGRTYEDAKYLPMVNCKGKFKRLENNKIKTVWD